MTATITSQVQCDSDPAQTMTIHLKDPTFGNFGTIGHTPSELVTHTVILKTYKLPVQLIWPITSSISLREQNNLNWLNKLLQVLERRRLVLCASRTRWAFEIMTMGLTI